MLRSFLLGQSSSRCLHCRARAVAKTCTIVLLVYLCEIPCTALLMFHFCQHTNLQRLLLERADKYSGVFLYESAYCTSDPVFFIYKIQMIWTNPSRSKREICPSFLSPYLNMGAFYCRKVKINRKNLVCVSVLCQIVAFH